MKVLTIKQPFASLIADGKKEYEFRTWKTNYRGPIYIHAGMTIDKEGLKRCGDIKYQYPQSRIIASADIVDCIKVTKEFKDTLYKKDNKVYDIGDFDGYAWKLENIKKIDDKRMIKGHLGLWRIDE